MAAILAKTVSDGHHIDYTPGADVAAGDVVIAGGVVGVTKDKILSGELGAIHPFHVVNVPKATGAGTDIGFGATLFWDPTPGRASKTASDGNPFGVCVRAATVDDTSVDVLMRPSGIGTAANVAALAQTTSGTYQQAEVQAIATKVDAILTALKNAGLMLTA